VSLLEEFKAACNYPGKLDEEAVNTALRRYCIALGVKRDVMRLRRGWRVEDIHALKCWALRIADDIKARRAASDASDASAASAASDASAASAARDARDASAARDARDASAALQRFTTWCLWRRSYWYDFEACWLSVIHCGAMQKKLESVRVWSEHCWNAFDNGCWILIWTDTTLYWVAKPELTLEEPRRLHNETGPALRNDLEDVYFWHGVLIPAKAINEPETITTDDIAGEDNAEVRRILIERLGAGKFLERANAKQLDVDVSKFNGTRALFRTDIRTPQGWLVCACPSTGRVYFMECDPNTKTCEEADKYLRGPALESAKLVGAT
jgi:hypothetical protein